MTKDIQPGKWDTSVGGHIASGEKLLDGIKREVLEEAGLTIDEKRLIPVAKYIFESDIEKELVFSFVYVTNEKINFQAEEIDEVKFYSLKDIQKLVHDNLTTQNFIKEYQLLNSSNFKGKIIT